MVVFFLSYFSSMIFLSRISEFLSHVFLVPEEPSSFQELFIDKNRYYLEQMGEFWQLSGAFIALKYTWDLKKELEAYKYHSQKHKKELFVPILQECFDMFCLENTDNNTLITTVPVHIFSYIKRWYNHSEILAEHLAISHDLTFLKLLKKTRFTKHQARLAKTHRLRNVRNSFSVRKKYISSLVGKDIIIVDDVISTGSTVNECARVLRACGAKRIFWLFLATSEYIS
jgi:competence protein ComFC